jgi:hypothetical protein
MSDDSSLDSDIEQTPCRHTMATRQQGGLDMNQIGRLTTTSTLSSSKDDKDDKDTNSEDDKETPTKPPPESNDDGGDAPFSCEG